MDEAELIEGKSDVSGVSGYRVVRISETLRETLRSRRIATGQTVRAFMAEAIEHELPSLVVALDELGISAEVGSAGRPSRLPISARGLATLRTAAETVGLPASLLLRISLARLARRKRRRPRSGLGDQAGAARSDPSRQRNGPGDKPKAPRAGSSRGKPTVDEGPSQLEEQEGSEGSRREATSFTLPPLPIKEHK